MNCLLFVLFLLKFVRIPCLVISDIKEEVVGVVEILNEGSEIVVAGLKVFRLIGDNVEAPRLGEVDTEMKLFDAIDDISMTLDEISDKLSLNDINSQSIWRRLDALSREIHLDLNLHSMMMYQVNIDNYYMDFQMYVMNWQRYENETLLDFASKIVDHDQNSVSYSMKHLHYAIFKDSTNGHSTIVDTLFDEANTHESRLFCTNKQSPQEMLSNFFYGLIHTEIKSITLQMFAYSMKRLYKHGDFEGEMNKSLEEYKNRMTTIESKMYSFVSKSSKHLWNCDPSKGHVLGETYEQFTNFIQGYILNEENLDDKENCWNTCTNEHFRFKKVPNCKDDWCRKQERCKKVIECQYVDKKMSVCENHNKSRNYDFIRFGNGMRYGNDDQGCKGKMQTLETYRQYWVSDCDYCICTCESRRDRNSDRFINLRASVADIKNNRVVTGLRFLKHNRIIHLQIQQGKLLPMATIDRNTIEWVPISDYKITDRRLNEGQDYIVLSYGIRSFDLDDLIVPEGYVVTGVRFRHIGQHVNLEMLATPFDFDAGTLYWTHSQYYGNWDTMMRKEITLKNSDIPTRFLANSRKSTNGTYVKFQCTDFKADAAQSTVPFFDTQPLVSLQPTPLSGIGVFHRGFRGSGGFIVPKMFTYDMSTHLKVPPK